MALFSVEPERSRWTKWVMLAALGIVGLIASLLIFVIAGCASAPEPQGWRATFKITVGNQPPMEWEADHADPETRRVVHPSGNNPKR